MFAHHSSIRIAPKLLLLILTALVLGPVASLATPAAASAASSDRAVSVELVPSRSSVFLEQQINYKVVVTNNSASPVRDIIITLPYHHDQIVPIGSQFKQASGDWVSSLDAGQIVMTFGKLGAGKRRTGKLLFRVRGRDTGRPTIALRAAYTWSGEGGGKGETPTVKVAVKGKKSQSRGVKSKGVKSKAARSRKAGH